MTRNLNVSLLAIDARASKPAAAEARPAAQQAHDLNPLVPELHHKILWFITTNRRILWHDVEMLKESLVTLTHVVEALHQEDAVRLDMVVAQAVEAEANQCRRHGFS